MVSRKIEQSEGFFWLGGGIFLGFAALRAEIGSLSEPGPGFIAFGAALFMFAVGAIMLCAGAGLRFFMSADGEADPEPPGEAPEPRLRILYTVALLFVYALLLVPLGYLPTTMLVLWGLFFNWDKRNWFSSFLFSLVTTGASYYFFEILLGLRFPRGILF